jgi:murein DD-endopeptidase MepM/ murein hydrolase activator NlpD
MVLRTERSKWKRKVFFAVVLAVIVIFIVKKIFITRNSDEQGSPQDIAQETQKEPVAEVAEEENVERCTIADGDIPADVFSTYGHYDANDTEALLKAATDVFDLTHLKIGQPLRFYFDKDGEKAVRMEYDCNTEKMIVVERDGDVFHVHEEQIQYTTTEETAKGVIDNFFYADALDAGLSESTVLEVGDIFSFSIDFTTEIREGDEFVFVYEKRKRNGVDAPDGRILGAKFVNDGTAHYAYYFSADGGDSQGGYYDGDGHVLERQFLKAPLSYRHITSGFTGARMHPITKKISAHYQVDYAAPTGTPVVASARGTVVSAGWEGGWGNMIRMTHDNGYTTHYGHLSAFAKGIKSGAHVDQGQVIGYVGSTGWSTGPHLDYGMKLNGSPINPITLVQPKGAPLADDKMEAFNAMKEKYKDILQ